VTSIGDEAFSGCSGLSSLTLPAGVTSLGYLAFAECSGLTSVTNLSGTPQSIDISMYVFLGLALENISLAVPASSVAAYGSAAVWEDFSPITGLARLEVAPNNASWGSIIGTAAGLYPVDTVVTLTAQPAGDYSFMGWQSGDTILGAGTTLSFTLTQDMLLTALFGKYATVTFRSWADTVGTQVVVAGDTVIRPVDPEQQGYVFGGWYSDFTLATPWSFSADVVSGNMTLYAKWTPVTYTISYHLNGGSHAPDTA
jgi:uncharacterized repeat protein (TIGR02543 family)